MARLPHYTNAEAAVRITSPILNFPEWVSESLEKVNEMRLTPEQEDKAKVEKVKAEKWLKDNGFTFDTHHHGGPHLFDIYIRDEFTR